MLFFFRLGFLPLFMIIVDLIPNPFFYNSKGTLQISQSEEADQVLIIKDFYAPFTVTHCMLVYFFYYNRENMNA